MPSARQRFGAWGVRAKSRNLSSEVGGWSRSRRRGGPIISGHRREIPPRWGRKTISSLESDARMFERVMAGDPDAFRQLYQRYYPRLVKVARATLKHVRSALAEPEGTADSALASLARIVREGGCQGLENLDHL